MSAAPRATQARVVWALLLAVVAVTAFVRWRLREVPLERDEGEYAYVGRLLLEGEPPYRDVANHKFPGTYVAYAALMAACGETPAGIRTGFIAVNAATVVAVFLFGRRVSGDVGGLGAAAAYAVTSLSPGVLGTAVHLTHFVVLPVVAGLLLVAVALAGDRLAVLAAGGASLGLAVVVRQTSLAFVALAVLWVLAGSWRDGRLVGRTTALVAGVAAPLALMTLWLQHAHVLGEFWRWTFVQAAAYGSQTPASEGLELFTGSTADVVGPAMLVWCAAGAGLVRAVWTRDRRSLLLIGLLVASCATVAAGLLFRTHYYIQMLPAVALLAGDVLAAAWAGARTRRTRALVALVALAAIAEPLWSDADVLFTLAPDAVARKLYDVNPFPEAEVVARHLRAHTRADDPIAILGSEPEILFLARRRSATRILYTYPLVELHAFAHVEQEETIREIEAARPPYLVYVGVPASWLVRPDSDLAIFGWAQRFIAANYRLEGIADILPDGTRWAWDDDAATYHPASPNTIRIFRRRDA